MIKQSLRVLKTRERMKFLPSIHHRFYIIGLESVLFNLADQFADEYNGGFWEYLVNENGVKIPMITGEIFKEVHSPMSGNSAYNMKSEYFSVAIWIIALSLLCSKHESGAGENDATPLYDLYELVKDWVANEYDRINEYIETANDQGVIKLLEEELEQFSKLYRLID